MGAASWPVGWHQSAPNQWENAYGCSVTIEHDSTDGEAWASIGVVVTIGYAGEDGAEALAAATSPAQSVEQILSRRPL